MKCKSCHAIVREDGTEVVKGGRTGPNLYGIIGRRIGGQDGYVYSQGLAAAGSNGEVWDEASFAAFVVDPSGWLAANAGASSSRSKMMFRLPRGGEDIASYLAQLR